MGCEQNILHGHTGLIGQVCTNPLLNTLHTVHCHVAQVACYRQACCRYHCHMCPTHLRGLMYEYHFHQGGMASKLQAEPMDNTDMGDTTCQQIGSTSELMYVHPLHGV